jgi:hypothetical protein
MIRKFIRILALVGLLMLVVAAFISQFRNPGVIWGDNLIESGPSGVMFLNAGIPDASANVAPIVRQWACTDGGPSACFLVGLI